MNVLRFDSESAWAETAAGLWRDRLRQRPHLRLCLAAGNTPRPLYAALAASVKRGAASFGQATVFALDEYGGLAADDPGGCAQMLRRHLVEHVDLDPERFHTLDAAAPDLEAVCHAYDAGIAEGFDLAVLGIGLNGHLGLNEPGTAADAATRRVELHPRSVQSSSAYVHGPRLPTWGLTVGLRQLLAAREVWLLATGATKAEVVRRLVHAPMDSSMPAMHLRRHASCFLFLDPEAGAQL